MFIWFLILIQQEWELLQQVTTNIGDAFGPVEESLQGSFMPAQFQGIGEGIMGWRVTRLPVKQAALSLLDLTITAPENCMASCAITGQIAAAIRVQEKFRIYRGGERRCVEAQ